MSTPDLDALMAGARSDNALDRQTAALALGARDTSSVIDELVDLMVHEREDFVRESLIWAITAQGKAAVPRLVAMLYEPDTDREHVLHTLSKIGDPSTVAAIIPDADNPDRVVAAKAWWALGRIGTPEALPPLLAHLGEGDAERRLGLTLALLQHGPPGIPALVEHLHTGSQAAREHAADILVRLADPDQYPLLQRREGEQEAAAEAVRHAPAEPMDAVLEALAADQESPRLAAVAQKLREDRGRLA